MTFNIGDKVRIINDGDNYGLTGELCSIKICSLSGKQLEYWIDNLDGMLYRAYKIELVNEPKKGNEMINNLSIKIQRKIECDFSATQWNLYTNKFPRKEIEKVADVLNIRLKSLVNDSLNTKEKVRSLMIEEMAGYSEYGTYDSEPVEFLDRVLDVIYFELNK